MPQGAKKEHGGAKKAPQGVVDEGEAYTVRKGLYKELLANSRGVNLDSSQRQIENILKAGAQGLFGGECRFIENVLTELYGVMRKQEVAEEEVKKDAAINEFAEEEVKKDAAINTAADQVIEMGFDKNLIKEAKVQQISNVNDMIEWIEAEEQKRRVLTPSKPKFEPEPEPEPEPEMNPRGSM